MGDWNTLHLFDDNTFYTETVPLLKGVQGDLRPYYESYLTTCLGGTCSISLQELVDIYNQMQNNFHDFPNFNELHDKGLSFLPQRDGPYHLSAFFEHVVFSDCADLLPNYILGKQPLQNQFPDILTGGLGNALVCELGCSHGNVFTSEGFGITGWLTAEEVDVLLADMEDYLALKPSIHEDDIWRIEDLGGFLTIATSLNMGILQGVDLRTDYLARLPQFKLSTRELWDSQKIERLTFI